MPWCCKYYWKFTENFIANSFSKVIVLHVNIDLIWVNYSSNFQVLCFVDLLRFVLEFGIFGWRFISQHIFIGGCGGSCSRAQYVSSYERSRRWASRNGLKLFQILITWCIKLCFIVNFFLFRTSYIGVCNSVVCRSGQFHQYTSHHRWMWVHNWTLNT